jgi:cohesin complex subunit SA-1/2
VFGTQKTLDDVAALWMGRFKNEDDQNKPVAEFFTFLLKCAGCDHQVDAQSLEDPDSFSSQIDDIQQTYQAVR